ncbi:MAG TPA: hypothetical protein VGL07_08480 [Buttiauxella sp.]
MDISVFTTTNDIEQLRTLALAMVQNAVSENVARRWRERRCCAASGVFIT